MQHPVECVNLIMLKVSFVTKYKLHHLLFWLVLFWGWYFFRYQDYTGNKAFIITAVKIAELSITVYVTNYLLIPKLIYRKKYVWFGLIFFVMIVASSLIKLQVIITILSSRQSIFTNLKLRIYDNVIPHFLLVSTGAAFKLLLDYATAQRQIARITKEKSQAELNFLKSQINPHFVFNTLNSIYFLIDKNNAAARDVLHKFSDMLRFQLYELNGEKIAIEKEIVYLKDYVDLQQLRLEHCLVHFNCPPNVSGFNVEPLLLIPFVENAFKHISHYSYKNNEVTLGFELEEEVFKFCISNTTEGTSQDVIGKHGGIGLANVKRRLELLYPAKHKLTITETDNCYKVDLTLKVDT